MAWTDSPAPYQGLPHSILQQLRRGAPGRRAKADRTNGLVIAFTAAHAGDNGDNLVEVHTLDLKKMHHSRDLTLERGDSLLAPRDKLEHIGLFMKATNRSVYFDPLTHAHLRLYRQIGASSAPCPGTGRMPYRMHAGG